MGLVTPDIGLVFWTTLSFLIVLFLLGKMAWKPILKGLKEREASIEDALQNAEKAREEMTKLQSGNEALLKEAREEREKMMVEARDMRDSMVSDAKVKAQEEADRMISQAKETINAEKNKAVAEIKNQVATLSIDIAEKILKTELASDDKQKALINNLIEDVNLN